MRTRKAACLTVVMALAMLPQTGFAAPASGSATVKGLYDTLLHTMKNGHILGQSGRFVQLEPVIRRSFDIGSMARLSVGWPLLGHADRCAASADDGQLRALHLGDLCRTL